MTTLLPLAARAAAPHDAGRSLGLDLLRAAAVGMVLLSHFSVMGAAFLQAPLRPLLAIGGLFGVELFFVLSGFLIGGILLRLIARPPGWRDWLLFMLRRWLRTLPLYLLWLAVLAVLLPPAADRAAHYLRYATLTQNLLWPMPADNWFGVSWSLSVEEWFYLTFSAALLATAALTRRAGAAWAVIGLFIAVPLAARLAMPVRPDFMTTTYKIAALRLDAIAAGVALARLRPARLPYPAVALGLGGLLLAALWGQASVGLVALPPALFAQAVPTGCTLGFALLFPAALRLRGAGWAAAVIRRISAQSYALYLVHLSMLDWMWTPILRWGMPRAAALPAAAAATLAVSWLLWRWVEQPILARRPTRWPPIPRA